jgi:hypothetical protein
VETTVGVGAPESTLGNGGACGRGGYGGKGGANPSSFSFLMPSDGRSCFSVTGFALSTVRVLPRNRNLHQISTHQHELYNTC